MAMNAPAPVIAAMSHSLAGIGGGAYDMMGSDVWSPKIEGKTGGGNSQAPEEMLSGQRCAANHRQIASVLAPPGNLE
jgi:hypothetical protein